MKRKIKRKNAPVVRAKQPESSKNEEKEEKKFDFGGLPNRNLKKNLGC